MILWDLKSGLTSGVIVNLQYTGFHLQRVKRCKESAGSKRVLVVTELFNIPVNDFDMKKAAPYSRVVAVTELAASGTQYKCRTINGHGLSDLRNFKTFSATNLNSFPQMRQLNISASPSSMFSFFSTVLYPFSFDWWVVFDWFSPLTLLSASGSEECSIDLHCLNDQWISSK